MRIMDVEISHYELAIAAAVGVLLVSLLFTKLPKALRIGLFVVAIAGGSASWLIEQNMILDQASAPVPQMSEEQPSAMKKAEEPGKAEELSAEKMAPPKPEAKPKQKMRSFAFESAPPPENNEQFETVRVLYGTDRAKIENAKRVSFNDKRGKKLKLGTAVVTIPKQVHNEGEIERPFEFNFLWIKYQAKEDPKKHFTIHKIGELGKDEFVSISKDILSKSSRFKDQAFVFIHGYNVSFDAALYRTAQMAYDFGFDGVPYMYSWPSVGGLVSYEYDQNSSIQARPYLREFLDIVTKESGAKEVHIIAHSMGNAPLMEVLRDLRMQPEDKRISNINQIVLAAPDIDRDVFINLAKEIKGLGKGMTLYVSSNDLAMKASRTYSGSIRAGDIPENGPIVIEGLDTIDVTSLSTSMFSLNHSLYADSGKILTDITKLMLNRLRPPNKRTPELQQADNADGTVFWRYDGKTE